MTVLAQAVPLAEEFELPIFMTCGFGLEAVRLIDVPLGPKLAHAVRFFQSHEVCEAVEPRGMLQGELATCFAIGGGCRLLEPVEGGAKQWVFPGDDRAVINFVDQGRRRTGDIVVEQAALFDERFEADQERIACKCGEQLIRGVAVTCRPERQHLPNGLSGRGKEIGKSKRLGAEIAYSESARQ